MDTLKYKSIFLVIALLFSLSIYANQEYLIGFSQCSSGDWRAQMESEMYRELIFHNDMEMIIKNAEDDAELQIRQIRELVAAGIDLLIVAPIEIDAIEPLVEEVYQSGLPVILIDRKTNSDNYTAYVGGDNVLIGNTAGTYLADKLKREGNIIEILGSLNSSPAIERMVGFETVISKYPHLKIIDKVYSNWNNKVVLDSLPSKLQSNSKISAIYAHTDFLAAAASEVVRQVMPDNDIVIVGIDGSPEAGGGIELVEKNVIDATLIYPTGGKEAIVLASKILSKQLFNKNNLLQTTLINNQNVKITRLQYNTIQNLQNDIVRSKDMLDLLGGRYKTQRLLLFVLLFSLVLVIVLIILLFIALKNKNIANYRLEKQKESISKQNVDLKQMSEQLEEVTQSRLSFYTNISHEFRTPLTLIIGPLESLITKTDAKSELNKELSIIYRNAVRLLRLVNQLMDFRKIENRKMQLKAGVYVLLDFMKGIKECFSDVLKQKQISLEITCYDPKIKVWFDWDKMDKVMFNLLSNAIKVSQKNERIQIIITGEEDMVKIEVKDHGEGIPTNELEKIFDRFYQVNKSNSYDGSGIGLSLTKELILLHKGEIKVQSELNVGTSFIIKLPLGNTHLKEEEMISINMQKQNFISPVYADFQETNTIEDHIRTEKTLDLLNEEKAVLLIVEDEPDVRNYIKTCFDLNHYIILEAEHGVEALQIIEEEGPDIIISDVMMPKMDGLELTRKVKSDLRFCHIPIVLLTAKSSLEHLLEGLEEGADSYIPKPFNKQHLILRVRKLIDAQRKIQEKYQATLINPKEDKGISKIDRRLLQRISDLVLDNEYSEKVNVEDLSSELGLSRVHLYRKIKKITGLSVSEFITQIKLKQAMVLLRRSEKAISEIAYQVGFSSPSYFTKCFKEQFKMSPTEFRDNL
ncbi:substrate-binding domain-containing protein [Carboxylicivirga linearis]|uniref:histidine kinase n=1 Tax=Carboxylicivirga linearis TaxID=1628157 RepID=A0ABS5JZF6_9BACT|nr:substrate-binding domain-containing protein [Carboxylicivirga linearis]MBS2100292.1 substrate-binding domain-containing protein [Carboxylicivirga linearis]